MNKNLSVSNPRNVFRFFANFTGEQIRYTACSEFTASHCHALLEAARETPA